MDRPKFDVGGVARANESHHRRNEKKKREPLSLEETLAKGYARRYSSTRGH